MGRPGRGRMFVCVGGIFCGAAGQGECVWCVVRGAGDNFGGCERNILPAC